MRSGWSDQRNARRYCGFEINYGSQIREFKA